MQTLKRAVRKYCQEAQTFADWDLHLQWVLLGYRCSVQAATGFSPYYMLYAQQPTIPPAVRGRMAEPLDFDNVETAAANVLARAELVKRACVAAGSNQRIAQHRDTLRYATIRGGSYMPKLRKFEPGDFVYVRRPERHGTLLSSARQEILRVVGVSEQGVATLQGRCGNTIKHNISNLAPCHLPNIDPTMELGAWTPGADLPCEVCRFPDDEAYMVLCDGCDTGWHTFCLVPPLASVPEGVWLCPRCTAAGVTATEVEAHVAARDSAVEAVQDQRATAATDRRRAAAATQAQALDEHHVSRKLRVAGSRRWATHTGLLHFVGAEAHPHYLRCEWDDGTIDFMSAATARKLKPTPPEPDSATSGGVPASAAGATGAARGRASGRRHAVAPTVALATLATLPPTWELAQPEQLLAALQLLMPGDWHQGHITGLARKMPGATGFLSSRLDGRPAPECVPTLDTEVERLLQCVHLGLCATVLDPFSGTGTMARVLSGRHHRVVTNDIFDGHAADYHMDALQPSFYTTMQRELGIIDAVVSSPWFAALDIALPLLVASAASVACVHVPGHYLTSGVMPRFAYLRELQAQGRLFVIMGLPRGPMGRRCVWLLVFSSRDVRQRLLAPGCRQLDGWAM